MNSLLSLFPNARNKPRYLIIMKIDSGHGRKSIRLSSKLCFTRWRFFPALPNGSQVGQERDQTFSDWEKGFYDNLEILTEYFLNHDGQDPGQNDLFLLIFGGKCGSAEDAPILVNTVDCNAIGKKICRAFNKVGIVQLTWNCLHDKKVWHELTINNEGQVEETSPEACRILQIEEHNEMSCDILNTFGYNGDLLYIKAPWRNIGKISK